MIIEQLQKFAVGQHLVQVLGELRQDDDASRIHVQALIVRDFNSVDPKLYHEAISAQVKNPNGYFFTKILTVLKVNPRSIVRDKVILS